MRIKVIVDDSVVGIDGNFRRVDLSGFGIAPDVHAISFDAIEGVGTIERRPGSKNGDSIIKTIDVLDEFIAAWQEAAQPAPEPPPPLSPADLELKRVAEIKNAAHVVILTRHPQWKQANMTARVVELIDKKISGPLTPEESAEFSAIQGAWKWVKSVRQTSDAAEASGQSADSVVWPL